jgi:hypothetical protein
MIFHRFLFIGPMPAALAGKAKAYNWSAGGKEHHPASAGFLNV